MSLATKDDQEEPVRSLTPPNGAQATPPAPALGFSPDDLVEHICDRVTAEVRSQFGGGDGGGPPTPPPKTVLGDTPKGWASWLIKGAVVVAASLFAWYMYVNDAIKIRPTYEEAGEMATKAMKAHEDHGRHVRLEKLVEQNSESLKKLSDIQIRQTAILEAHEKAISDGERKLERHIDRNRGQ